MVVNGVEEFLGCGTLETCYYETESIVKQGRLLIIESNP